ncbi:DUF2946 family protein [Antarcticimicrobium luteum]|uniref:Uncharacterized protein n=1 Tax=Antarcticimicrobium luteum TaxID=2547397 RepID=A0A4R5UTB3_9RHOB|nr:DUF2946 family protein [Antarcticimicrobium luteum]TDK42379.1 hypothetical protein E1832_19790 [Antarcticimicrobium luteum]
MLLLALLGTATVPNGLMRAQGPDGMRLVLCTSDGTQEVWLTDDGEAIPVEDGHPGDADHDQPHCVQVSVAGTEAPTPIGALVRLPRWPTAPPAITAQRPTGQSRPTRHRVRAPPVQV